MERVARHKSVLNEYQHTRNHSVNLCSRLTPEDAQIQAHPYASPSKWHLAHTTWFFDQFVLSEFAERPRDEPEIYGVIFNSYYEGIGRQHPRGARGILSRPTLHTVLEWRRRVDEQVIELLEKGCAPEVVDMVELGVHHEKQHQELFLTDILANFEANPLAPAYLRESDSLDRPRDRSRSKDPGTEKRTWTRCTGGRVAIGHAGNGFAYDNELPRHDVLVQDFEISNSLVSNGEVMAFIEDGGYSDHRLWLSDGISWVRENNIKAPGYWSRDQDGAWQQFTLHGLQRLDPASPAVHLSGYEAEAIATWLGARLPTEFEWEHAAAQCPTGPESGRFERDWYLPEDFTQGGSKLRSLWGEVWEWTRSAYLPYPGYKPADGAVGEYNGKFMSSQWVLRGGSLATARRHLRASYRNFFYPNERWQFMGVRIARTA